jgi:hypothetical protein
LPDGAQKPGETLTAGDLLAASQASLNEIVAAIIRDGPAGRWQAGNALNALRYHNWGVWIHVRR